MTTREKILQVTRELLALGGIGAVSFDAIARGLGLSKQAVLYWFPSKQELLAEMFVGWLNAEADAAVVALAGAGRGAEAIRAFVSAIAGFHLASLDRFRMMYLVPQTLRGGATDAPDDAVLARIHAATSRLYGALAERLEGTPLAARREAVAVHSAVLGLVLMFGLAEAAGDPLKHASDDLIAALVTRLTGQVRPDPG